MDSVSFSMVETFSSNPTLVVSVVLFVLVLFCFMYWENCPINEMNQTHKRILYNTWMDEYDTDSCGVVYVVAALKKSCSIQVVVFSSTHSSVLSRWHSCRGLK